MVLAYESWGPSRGSIFCPATLVPVPIPWRQYFHQRRRNTNARGTSSLEFRVGMCWPNNGSYDGYEVPRPTSWASDRRNRNEEYNIYSCNHNQRATKLAEISNLSKNDRSTSQSNTTTRSMVEKIIIQKLITIINQSINSIIKYAQRTKQKAYPRLI